MNSLGLSIILKMGCICSRETILINSRKYYVLEHLGEGGFSTVDLVEDAHTHKTYAVKKIICHGEEDLKVAMKEIEYYGLLKHPNIIECFDSALKDRPNPVLNSISEVMIVLPYYKRGTLAFDLERRSVHREYMNASEMLNMFLHICEGVKAFHEAKPNPLAHRDLKTANILISDDQSPVIMDLGSVAVARVKICGSSEAQQLQDLASERCSMPYRAPELFSVESYCMIDERTDIWSLGCILYAMCYFKSPFDAVYERGDSVALAVISGNITFPDSSPYDPEIHELILYMLRVNPMERPYIYSVIEKTLDVISKIEVKA
ncbi:Serine/threonine-protein kinase 16 [Cryptotermes secundus]|uniref:non-specific serine/threonine protein kinase n=1 Tax=Cryptotermes secundus TaxID=105785 RepID=A0A2J7RE03_9NEOP|nr:serine/threonine-protein kinase 16 isoform X1 [Cryptotermes secundus]PNF39061.1 Serine/threonine-protein kinase 16 [Cryptotermes secundus]